MSLRSVFVLGILIPGMFVALAHRFAGLLLYIWFALFRPQEWLWIDISALRPSLIIGLLLVVPSLITGVFPNLTHPLSLGAIAFVVFSVIAQAVAVDPQVGWMWLDYLIRLVMVCLLMITIVDTPKRLATTLIVMAGSFGFHGAKAGLASLLAGGVQFYDGLAGAFVDNNGYALGCVMVMPLLVAAGQNFHLLFRGSTLESPRHWARFLFFAAVPLCAFAVVSLFSRGAFVALVATAIAFALVQKRRLLAVMALCVLVAGAYAVVPMPKGYTDRLSTIQNYDEVEDTSALGRLHFWRVAVRMSLDRPLGVGLRGFEEAYDQYDTSFGDYGRRRAVHNSHLQVLTDIGFGGGFAYVVLIGYSVFLALRMRARALRSGVPTGASRFFVSISNASIASMTAYVVGGCFVSMPLNDLTWLTFALVASLDRLAAQHCPQPQRAALPAQVMFSTPVAAQRSV